MTKSKKGHPASRRDAEEAFDKAQASTDPVRTQLFTMIGVFARAMADYNKAHGYNIGRPKGTTGPSKKAEAELAPAYAYMQELHRQTGEARPHTLARLAYNAKKTPRRGGRASQIRRSAAYWKAQNVTK
ncbi:MAG: hypothetical protein O7B24_09860 [Alphaproteobacteria bacterium]|nr:hypothetical protein [Alphaproteobacteria bacterium]